MVELSISSAGVELSPGSEVILLRQSWMDYEAILGRRQGKAGVKVFYSARTQEIRMMAPLPKHGNLSDALSDAVKLMLRRSDRDWQAFDPITLKRIGEAGLEPDACFYIKQLEAILGKEQIDLAIDPPPDLAIEVDATSATNPEDYEPLRIPELWIYKDDELRIFVFRDQCYLEVDQSPTFSDIRLRQLIPHYLRRAWLAGSSVALRELEKELDEKT